MQPSEVSMTEDVDNKV